VVFTVITPSLSAAFSLSVISENIPTEPAAEDTSGPLPPFSPLPAETEISLQNETGGEPDEEENEAHADRLIRAYMRHVYPWAGFGYGTWMACPDGSFYEIQVLFPGLYNKTDSEQKILKYPVYFRKKAPRQQK
jgi:hypothetical protein